MEGIRAMSKLTVAGLAGGLVLSASVLMAQGPITDRLPPTTLHGTIVEVSCFRAKGAATVASADQIACAKAAMAKDGVIGILSDGDGLFKIVGPLAASSAAKLVPYLGRNVDLAGAEVIISNNYDYRSFEGQRVTPVAATKTKK
jgi:hypothetical protein